MHQIGPTRLLSEQRRIKQESINVSNPFAKTFLITPDSTKPYRWANQTYIMARALEPLIQQFTEPLHALLPGIQIISNK